MDIPREIIPTFEIVAALSIFMGLAAWWNYRWLMPLY
jgi:hypothetical protein